MNKTQWEEAYNEFNAVHTELFLHERNYKNGSNKKKREMAERQIGNAKHNVHHLFRKYPEVYDLLTGGEKASDFGRAIQMDEFFQDRYIVNDLGSLLNLIKEKINSLKNEENS